MININKPTQSNLSVRTLSACSLPFSFDFSLPTDLESISLEGKINLLKDLVENYSIENPHSFFSSLGKLFPIEEKDLEQTLANAKLLLEEAKISLAIEKEKHFFSIEDFFFSALDMLTNMLDAIIETFGLGSLFSSSDNQIHSNVKSSQLSMLIGLFTMITGSILPIIGVATGGAIVGGIFLALASLSIIWPYIKPMPTHLPLNAENWTKEYGKGPSAITGRKDCLNKMANTLAAGRHALLVGPSRVGKTVTAKAFARAIAKGEYPALKGMTVFRLNTTDLTESAFSLGAQDNPLSNIRKAMGRHKDRIILVLDEIHVASRKGEKIAEQLKTLLDEGGDFVHVIGITTSEEYQAHVATNTAFSLRFDQIQVQEMDETETLSALAEILLQEKQMPVVEEGVLKEIYQASSSENNAQPASAINLLKRSLTAIKSTSYSPTQEKITALSNQIIAMQKNVLVTRHKEISDRDNLLSIEKELGALQKQLLQEKTQRALLEQKQAFLDLMTKRKYELIYKIASAPNNSYKKELFWIEQAIPLLEQFIINYEKTLGVYTHLSTRLITELTKKQKT